MKLKQRILKQVAKSLVKKLKKDASKALVHQQKIMLQLIHSTKNTAYGKSHSFEKINDYASFIKYVPLTSYDKLFPYIKNIMQGESNVLWPGKPKYIAKTSGTTGGFKFIPVSKQAMPFHIKAARNSLIYYLTQTNKLGFLEGKMILLQGSPALENMNGVLTGRLSGIVAHHIPKYLRDNRLPTYATNCLVDWNEKTDAIVKETLHADMRLFAGIPSWLTNYMEKLLAASGKKTLVELYPNLQLLIVGGTGYEPFAKKFTALAGKELDVIETYSATEGFIAYQDHHPNTGLLLNTNAGIFYEFIPVEEFEKPGAKRVWLGEIELNKNYVIILNTNSGFFGYVVGDTVEFVSKDPYRINVTGRIKEYISAFGEQVYAQQTDTALKQTLEETNALANEYHVSPIIKIDGKGSHHLWQIEFERIPTNIHVFEKKLDQHLHTHNMYYRDIVALGVIAPLKIECIQKNGFYKTMETMGKAGEQHKIPKLANDTTFSQHLKKYTE